jgi:peptide/nickel transport system substrate-binding protein
MSIENGSKDEGVVEKVLASGLSRRALLGRALLARLSLPAAGALLAACGGDDEDAATATPSSGGGDATGTTGGDAETTPTSGDTGGEPVQGGTLIHATGATAETFDPHRLTALFEGFVSKQVCENLIDLNFDLEYDPILAESYEVSEDALVYTFNLRQDIVFSDGTPFNAEAVNVSFNRSVDENAPYPEHFGTGTWEVVDDYTFVMTLTEPYGALLFTIAADEAGIVSPAAVEAAGGDLSREPVGYGPFIFSDWVEGEQITLTRNENYVNYHTYATNKGPVYIDELVLRFIPEEQTRLAAFESGEVHIVDIPGAQYSRYADDPQYQMIRNELETRLTYLAFTMVEEGETAVFRAPWEETGVRQAAAYAINAQEVIDAILGGLAIRNPAPMPVGCPGYTDAYKQIGYEYDPDQANALLDEAGWTMGDDGVREKDGEPLSILFMSPSSATNERVCQLFQDQLRQVGFDVEYQALEGGVFNDALENDEMDLTFASYGWGDPDYVWWVGNDSGIQPGIYGLYNPEYEQKAAEGWNYSEIDQRSAVYLEASELMLADPPMVPLWSIIPVLGARQEVKGFRWGPQGGVREYFGDTYIASE